MIMYLYSINFADTCEKNNKIYVLGCCTKCIIDYFIVICFSAKMSHTPNASVIRYLDSRFMQDCTIKQHCEGASHAFKVSKFQLFLFFNKDPTIHHHYKICP